MHTSIVSSQTGKVHAIVKVLHNKVSTSPAMSAGNTRYLNSSEDRFDALKAQVDMIATSVRTIAEILKQAYRPKVIPSPKFISGDNENM